MKQATKDSVRRGSKIDRLLRARDRLRSTWIGLDQHRGLEDLAPPVEAALDRVEEQLRELGVDPGGEGELSGDQIDALATWDPDEGP